MHRTLLECKYRCVCLCVQTHVLEWRLVADESTESWLGPMGAKAPLPNIAPTQLCQSLTSSIPIKK